ncbi:tubulin-specific chaperone E [Galendromus occidentalis]|uniref:Tubulin-specific chaperone E n=1 Tax=Galendromus occidentalis TaxID=34638 RepID=A0AAJ6QVM3_9ACAR|nr:tubulin-specific chaperone E [Galendromus occidentalis]
MESPVSVGTRVSVDGYYGTVRFYGSVKGTQGTWLGIEWDDATRGKHNGCYNGTQYFKARHATGGSFVRPTKADLGISVREAIKMKYFNHETDEKLKKEISENSKDVWLLGNVGNTQSNLKCIEFVGPEKISELQSRQELLRIVNLRNMPVSSAGREICSVAPMIVELDLSHTLLSHWDCVALIAQQLTHLTELKLGKNHLQVPSLVTKHQEAFQSVKRIWLESSSLTWEHILQLAPMWPHIEALEVSANNIGVLSTPPKSIFGNLEALSLQENPLSSWQDVVKLASLPKLRELYLNGCKIEEISFPTGAGGKTELFPKLERLEVTNNKISSWKSVAELEKLASLRTLRVNGNPITHGNFEDVFYDIIGRLSVGNINRMDVSKDTRKEAELYYLRKYFPEYQRLREGENHRCEFLQSHPRFQKLLDIYGEPTIAVADIAPTTIKSSLISLEFVVVDEPSVEPIAKKIPSTVTLGNLKRMVNVLFKRKAARKPQLTYFPTNGRFGDTGRPEYEFGNDLRDLNFYDIEDGDKIFVRW